MFLNCLLATGQLSEGDLYDVDFDHQIIATEKYDAKPTYRIFSGYRPGAIIGDMIVGIENSDGNANVRFHLEDTQKRLFERLERKKLAVNRFWADGGSCPEDIVEEVRKHCRTFCIRANHCCSLYDDIFALNGWKREEINRIEFELNFILVKKWTGKPYRLVIQRQRRLDGEPGLWEGDFYKTAIRRFDVKRFNLKATSRIKAFVFKFISVPAEWIGTSRQYEKVVSEIRHC